MNDFCMTLFLSRLSGVSEGSAGGVGGRTVCRASRCCQRLLGVHFFGRKGVRDGRGIGDGERNCRRRHASDLLPVAGSYIIIIITALTSKGLCGTWSFWATLPRISELFSTASCFPFQYFHPIVEKLLETTDRADAATANLRSAAYEALMEMVKNSPKV